MHFYQLRTCPKRGEAQTTFGTNIFLKMNAGGAAPHTAQPVLQWLRCLPLPVPKPSAKPVTTNSTPLPLPPKHQPKMPLLLPVPVPFSCSLLQFPTHCSRSSGFSILVVPIISISSYLPQLRLSTPEGSCWRTGALSNMKETTPGSSQGRAFPACLGTAFCAFHIHSHGSHTE